MSKTETNNEFNPTFGPVILGVMSRTNYHPMHSDDNPYKPSNVADEHGHATFLPQPWITKRRIAGLLATIPFIVALLFGIYVFGYTPEWFVSADMQADGGFILRCVMYVISIMSIAVILMLPASIWLWVDNWHPRITGSSALIFGILLIPALFIIKVLIDTYLAFPHYM